MEKEYKQIIILNKQINLHILYFHWYKLLGIKEKVLITET